MAESAKSKIAWILVGAVIASGFAFGFNYVLDRTRDREATLIWEAKETLPIQDKDQSTAIYHVRIDNEGNKEAEKVTCTIAIDGGKIEKPKVARPESMRYTESLTPDLLTEGFESVNPGESIQISVLASGRAELPPKPKVTLRFKGGNGRERSETRTPATSSNYLLIQWVQFLALPFFLSSLIGAYSFCDFVRSRLGCHFCQVEIEVKIINEDYLKVRVLKGLWIANGWVSMTSIAERHKATGLYQGDLRKLGNGKHTVQAH
ncbi:MAG: hypothetical protein WKF75_00155 [Singulisphaera sp.]